MYSPTLVHFRDPDSRFRVLAKHRSVFLIPLGSQAVGFLLFFVHSVHCGKGGIRTLDRGLTPYNGLAIRRLQPLGHLSKLSKFFQNTSQ